jgi:Protein of unknown function (DUF1097)
MNLNLATAIVVGVLATLVTWIFLGPISGLGLSLWAVFIAWGSFFSAGGGESGLKTAILGALWGSVCGTIALVLMNSGVLAGLGSWAVPVIFGLAAALLVLGANIPWFAAIPAGVYGFASTAAFAFTGNHVGDALSTNIAASPLLNIFTSMVIGALVGYLSQKMVGMLASD